MSRSLVWFSRDLRVQDNACLTLAQDSESLLCVYFLNPAQWAENRFGLKNAGPKRLQFILQSILELRESLRRMGQNLLVVMEPPERALPKLVAQFKIQRLIKAREHCYNEVQTWQSLVNFSKSSEAKTASATLASVQWLLVDNLTLFSRQQRNALLPGFPCSFSKFRKQAEELSVITPSTKPDYLPPAPDGANFYLPNFSELVSCNSEPDIKGGEFAGLAQLETYFSGTHPLIYKNTRDELDGWQNSTKLSPWLAQGCISPRQILAKLKQFEQDNTANESTYWIYFELLWREYFQYYAHFHGAKLFAFSGINGRRPLTTYYAERFRRWCDGTTPFALVNALMRELKATGYMSNRGRQIAASALVNELGIDWRWGAAYFEQELIDYDPAVNWGNWQYIAGVGADPRGGRHFDLDKQQRQFDPEQRFIQRWSAGEEALTQKAQIPLDSVDMVDWPIL